MEGAVLGVKFFGTLLYFTAISFGRNNWSNFSFVAKTTEIIAAKNTEIIAVKNTELFAAKFEILPIHKSLGFGNRLSMYWYGRSIFYWNQQHFEFSPRLWSNWQGPYLKTFLPYLPRKKAYQIDGNSTNMSGLFIQLLLFKQKLKNVGVAFNWTRHMRYPHAFSYLFTFYNRHFLPILQKDTSEALAHYFRTQPSPKNIPFFERKLSR
ncbi:hypothetical protein RFI_14604 [Reticulomyxa filosa]|uniref:Uncharacterized protein n=1 Tax=Reticulomyxa filosa TaxID=46433 RepID=X6N8I1_RETFI|nr:hypothetical protein RFI_14604 [Reticulomyxa filosa]|eukprot:ETO22590.1 hypothetical protein RFI_14604 [Reticulomyxa filosa]